MARRRSAAVDAHLQAILELTDHGPPADTGYLMARVKVSVAAASEVLRKLADEDL